MWQKFRNSYCFQQIRWCFTWTLCMDDLIVRNKFMMHNHAENVEKQGYYSSGLSPRLTRHFGLDLDRPTSFGALSRSLRQRNRLAATASASSHGVSKAHKWSMKALRHVVHDCDQYLRCLQGCCHVGEFIHLLHRVLSHDNGILCCHITNPHDLGVVPTDLQARFGGLLHQAWCHGLHVLLDVSQQSEVIRKVEVCWWLPRYPKAISVHGSPHNKVDGKKEEEGKENTSHQSQWWREPCSYPRAEAAAISLVKTKSIDRRRWYSKLGLMMAARWRSALCTADHWVCFQLKMLKTAHPKPDFQLSSQVMMLLAKSVCHTPVKLLKLTADEITLSDTKWAGPGLNLCQLWVEWLKGASTGSDGWWRQTDDVGVNTLEGTCSWSVDFPGLITAFTAWWNILDHHSCIMYNLNKTWALLYITNRITSCLTCRTLTLLFLINKYVKMCEWCGRVPDWPDWWIFFVLSCHS